MKELEVMYQDFSRIRKPLSAIDELPKNGVLLMVLYDDSGFIDRWFGTDFYSLWFNERNFISYQWDEEDTYFRVKPFKHPSKWKKKYKKDVVPKGSHIFTGVAVSSEDYKKAIVIMNAEMRE